MNECMMLLPVERIHPGLSYSQSALFAKHQLSSGHRSSHAACPARSQPVSSALGGEAWFPFSIQGRAPSRVTKWSASFLANWPLWMLSPSGALHPQVSFHMFAGPCACLPALLQPFPVPSAGSKGASLPRAPLWGVSALPWTVNSACSERWHQLLPSTASRIFRP